MKLLRSLLPVILFLATVSSSMYGASITSAQDGNWSVPATWTGAAVPTGADSVSISHTVTVTTATPECGSLTVEASGKLWLAGTAEAATLTFSPSSTLYSTGELRVADSTYPCTLRATSGAFTWTGTFPAFNNNTLQLSRCDISMDLSIASGTRVKFTGDCTIDAINIYFGGTLECTTDGVKIKGNSVKDIMGNDGSRIVMLPSSVVSGITIEGVRAIGVSGSHEMSYIDISGVGTSTSMFSASGTGTLTYLDVSMSTTNGAAFMDYQDSNIQNCSFTSVNGPGMRVTSSRTVVATNCAFSGKDTAYNTCDIYTSSSDNNTYLENCSFDKVGTIQDNNRGLIVAKNSSSKTWDLWGPVTASSLLSGWKISDVPSDHAVTMNRFDYSQTRVSNTVTMDASMSCKSLSIEADIILAESGSRMLRVSDAFINRGTYTKGTGTVEIYDASRPCTIEGSTSFNSLVCTAEGKAITFEAGSVTTIEAGLVLTGSSNNRVTLRSSSAGSQWKIDPQVSRSVSYVDVQDSNNINATKITPSYSINRGNNTNWFSGYLWTWNGLGSDCNWSTPQNWEYPYVPLSTAEVYFDATGTKTSTVDAGFAGIVASLLVKTGYNSALTVQTPLTVTGKLSLEAGAVTQEANMSIGTYEQTGGTFRCASPASYTFDVTGSFSLPTGTSLTGAFKRFTGSGSSGSPYIVRDVYDFQAINCYQSSSSYFSQNNDIDMYKTHVWNWKQSLGTYEGLVPIGFDTGIFSGYYNGNNRIISNVYVSKEASNYIGLFGSSIGAISNTNIVSGKVRGMGYVGMLCASARSVTNSSASGQVTGNQIVGGLVGLFEGELISESTSNVTVTGESFVGGLLGYSTRNTNQISRCSSKGDVSASATISGGLVGYELNGIVNDSYATGNVTGAGNVGGLVGYSSMCSYSNSYATGNVSAGGGGFLGYDSSTTINNCFYSGTPDNGKGTKVSSAQIKQRGTFSGWDFGGAWLIDENKSSPYLTNEAWVLNSGGSWTTGADWKKGYIVQTTYPQTSSDTAYIPLGVSCNVPAGLTLGQLSLSPGSGTATLLGTLELDASGTRGGSLNIYGGTLDANSRLMNIDGNFKKAASATFTRGTSTVNFADATVNTSIEGNTTFYNLSCTTAGKNISFEAGSITTIEASGALALTGSSGSKIKLRSSSSPTQWKIDVPGTRSLSNLDVMDSNNINATAMLVTSFTNSGNNLNWTAAITFDVLQLGGD